MHNALNNVESTDGLGGRDLGLQVSGNLVDDSAKRFQLGLLAAEAASRRDRVAVGTDHGFSPLNAIIKDADGLDKYYRSRTV